MVHYCGRGALDCHVMMYVMRSGNHTEVELGMFKIWNRLYTDEVPKFVAEFCDNYNEQALEAFKHRWLYMEDAATASVAMGITVKKFKKLLKAFRVDMETALKVAYSSGRFDD